MKYLIVNADDFGWSEKVNEGIVEAYHDGILTSATLFANAPATEHAVSLAKSKSAKEFSVGVHLCYGPWPPLLPAEELDAIFSSQGKPKFPNAKLWLQSSLCPETAGQLYLHFRSQIQSLQDKGISISHLDTHKHLHYWPAVFKIVLKLAEEFHIPSIRLINPSLFESGPLNLKMRMIIMALSLPQMMNRGRIKKSAISFADNFIGIPQTGSWTKAMFLDTLNSLKLGVTEIMSHPGYPDGLESDATRLVQSRQAELEILTDHAVKEFFSKCQNIKLIGYRDLPRINRVR